MIYMKKALKAPLIVMFMLLLTSCSFDFYTVASGNLERGVSFDFFGSSIDGEPSKFKILSFVVQELEGDKNWETIWGVSGEQKLNGISYGQKYNGLTERVPSKPLQLGKKYRVVVSASKWPKSGVGYSGLEFYIDEQGLVSN